MQNMHFLLFSLILFSRHSWRNRNFYLKQSDSRAHAAAHVPLLLWACSLDSRCIFTLRVTSIFNACYYMRKLGSDTMSAQKVKQEQLHSSIWVLIWYVQGQYWVANTQDVCHDHRTSIDMFCMDSWIGLNRRVSVPSDTAEIPPGFPEHSSNMADLHSHFLWRYKVQWFEFEVNKTGFSPNHKVMNLLSAVLGSSVKPVTLDRPYLVKVHLPAVNLIMWMVCHVL